MNKNLTLNITMNEKRVLKEIFNHNNISRTQISKNLEINKATISSILNSLKAKSLVLEVGEGDSTKSGGRKPILLKVNDQYGYFISLDLTYNSVEILYTYFDGTIITHNSHPLTDKKLSSILHILQQKINVTDKQSTLHGLLGISVSIHGIVDDHHNIIHLPFHETDVNDITIELQQLATVPVVIENEANLSALYEHNINGNRDINNLIALSIHKGIGAGLIINQQLYRGANGEAGEIGKTLVSKQTEVGTTFYKIEDICSQEALIQLLSTKLNKNITLQDLIHLYNKQQPEVIATVNQFIQHVAVLVHNLNTQFNPNAIYINCPLINALPTILEDIKQQFSQYSRNAISIELTSNVNYATLLGGTLAITQTIVDIDNLQINI
nr:ROK family transcriptional regulator [Staphylococcus arlettae]